MTRRNSISLKRCTLLFAVPLLAFLVAAPGAGQSARTAERMVVVDNFDANVEGQPLKRWRFFNSRTGQYEGLDRYMNKNERFYAITEGRNTFVRGETIGEALRISLKNDDESFDWRFDEHPWLQWRWRALSLPEGASERDKNDTGGAIYVTFGSDWLGRPRSIKYTYSSTLPVGTVISFGRVLKVIVVSSGRDGTGQWQTVKRNVVDDYRRVFDRDPPDRPESITLWSDSDNTGSRAVVDYDDIVIVEE
jgi:hypothetical protein